MKKNKRYKWQHRRYVRHIKAAKGHSLADRGGFRYILTVTSYAPH